MPIVTDHIDELKVLFSSHHVERAYLVGSSDTSDFNDNSDIDLLVRFQPFAREKYFQNYMDLKSALEGIFNRKVDLIEEQTLRNPILIQSLERSKKLIYG